MEKATKARTKKEAVAQEFSATGRYIKYSPYKLRPIADVMRGKDVRYALNWLTTYKTQRAEPIRKVLDSAIANAKSWKDVSPDTLTVKEIRIDQGPIQRYFKPGAQGRAQFQRKRQCHISIILQTKELTR